MTFKLSALVKEIPTLQKLAQPLRRLQSIQSLYTRIIPSELQHSTQVGFIEKECLVILAFHGSAAANLRQRAPSILKQLQDFDPAIEKIKIEVQVHPTPVSNADSHKVSRTLPESGIKSFQVLADELSDSPLREAIKRLLKK